MQSWWDIYQAYILICNLCLKENASVINMSLFPLQYDDSADIVAAAIKLFPYFLFHLGSNYNHLLQELIV